MAEPSWKCCCMAQQSCLHAWQKANSHAIMMPSLTAAVPCRPCLNRPLLIRPASTFHCCGAATCPEICRGRYEAARRVLLRAVHTCPGAKALWLDGLHLLAEQVMQPAGHWHWAVFGHRTCVKCIPCHVHVAVQCLCIYTSAAGVKQDIQEPLTFLPPQFLGIVSHQSLACHNPIDAIHKSL